MTDKLAHPTWDRHPSQSSAHWLVLRGRANCMVRTTPAHNGRFMFQFRNHVSYADTVAEAKDYVEACVELGRWPG
jgi:hypothetical protein